MTVSIIIINYNTPGLVYDCLESIQNNLKTDYEVIVVDNASAEKIDQSKIARYKQTRLVVSEKNRGFGGGNNLGASHASGELLWFLNSDTLLPDNSIEKVFDLLNTRKDIAIASPLLYNDRAMKHLQDDLYASFQNLRNVILRTVKPKEVIKKENYFEVDVVVGASLIIKRDVFDKIGGFDEKIFMFFDDDDLCFRTKQLGYKVVVAEGARIIHLQGQSIKKNRIRKKLYYRSQDYFWRKHYGLFQMILMKTIRLPYLLYRHLETGRNEERKTTNRFGIDVREVAGNKAGKGYYVFELVNHLAKTDRKNDYTLYTNKPFDWNLPKNFTIKTIPGTSFLWHLRLGKALKQDQIDVFLATLSYASTIFSTVPTVLVVHDLAVFYAPVKSRRKSVISEKLTLRLATNKAKRIIAISESTKHALITYNPKLKNKIETIPLAASERFKPREHKEYQSVITKHSLTPGCILFVGTLEPRKNIVTLIKAFSLLPPELQANHPLNIVGKKGWYYEEIFDTVKQLNLENKVHFLQYISNEDLPLIYNCAAVFVFPSFYEGFGLPVLEAIKSGVPTIISDAEALVEIGKDGSLVVRAEDCADLAQKITEVLTNKNTARDLIEKGLKHIERYSWETTAQKTRDLVTRVAIR